MFASWKDPTQEIVGIDLEKRWFLQLISPNKLPIYPHTSLTQYAFPPLPQIPVKLCWRRLSSYRFRNQGQYRGDSPPWRELIGPWVIWREGLSLYQNRGDLVWICPRGHLRNRTGSTRRTIIRCLARYRGRRRYSGGSFSTSRLPWISPPEWPFDV